MVRTFVLYCIALFVAMTIPARALVINELLANEPQSRVSLEWLEIYNPTDSSINMNDFYLLIDGNILPINESVLIGGDQHLILCRKLLADFNSDGFESYWGDNSGVWGDTPSEAAMIKPIEIPIALSNSGGTIQLFENSGQLYSSFVWITSGTDGYSWERVEPFSDSIMQSEDVTGSTPGSINSVTRLDNDLAIQSVVVKKTYCTETQFEIEISNKGKQIVEFATLWIHYPLGDTVTFVGLPPIEPDSSYNVFGEIYLSGDFIELEISLTSDDRESNNHLSRIFPGNLYQSLILNELMVNPPTVIGSEWIELYNNSAQAIVLSGYSFIVGEDLVDLSDLSITIAPNEYYILAQDQQSFNDYYGANFNISEPSSWQLMRNSSDTISVVDQFDIICDELIYNALPNEGYTLSREDLTESDCRFGFSSDYGGTPGAENRSLFRPSAGALALTVEPSIFSSSGSGTENETEIIFTAPSAEQYTLLIYDRYGRLVKTFYDGMSQIPESIRWDGRSDNGVKLPVGIYLIYGEASNIGSIKETVVIAP